MKKKGIIILICLSIGLSQFVSGCGFRKDESSLEIIDSSSDSQSSGTTDENSEEADSSTEGKSIFVFVCGQVQNSGVYELDNGSRIVDAINAAGGFLKKADVNSLNQAELLTDGQRIYIPKVGEVAADAGGTSNTEPGDNSNDGKVNINTATKDELLSLPGVGAAKADAIIEYRTEHGAFKSPEELKNISGIKDGVYNKIKDSIIVG